MWYTDWIDCTEVFFFTIFIQINIQVIRQYGKNNIVMVSYTTTPGTAEAYTDFFPKADTLDFQHGQNQKNIEITLEQDDIPEGPEMFYINITSVRRIIPRFVIKYSFINYYISNKILSMVEKHFWILIVYRNLKICKKKKKKKKKIFVRKLVSRNCHEYGKPN